METVTTTTTTIEPGKTPGIVIFVAILNFLTAFFAGLGTLAGLILLFVGGTMRTQFENYVAQNAAVQPGAPATSQGTVMMIGGIITFLAAIFGLSAFLIGRGLLKGKKWAWYVQLTSSVLGLFAFPTGTVVSVVILYFFFQPKIRAYFGV